ncbi:hypothetical protein [Leptolyngbya ohadii]|uniref:hypothetical protein n=1 Tax=Leptolyngbya ohadii TaxID=1962290 RepID=UPI000B59990D|nr:hypothetical protein [Leptolyngbya ohadii]
MSSEFEPNQQESGFLVEPDQKHIDNVNRTIGTSVSDDEILKDFDRSSRDNGSSGKTTETLCGCSGSCNCAPCNCLSSRAVDEADNFDFAEGQRSPGGSDKSPSDLLSENIKSALQDILQENRTDGEGIDFDAVRGQLGGEVQELVDDFVERFQRTGDRAA